MKFKGIVSSALICLLLKGAECSEPWIDLVFNIEFIFQIGIFFHFSEEFPSVITAQLQAQQSVAGKEV